MEPDKRVPGTSKMKKVTKPKEISKKPKEIAKATKDPKPTTSTEAPVTNKAYQTVYDIVYEAIKTLGTTNKGVSLQLIKKHVYGVKGDEKNFDKLIKNAIVKGFENGVFAKPKNKEFTGASGSFVLAKKKVVSKNSEKLKQKNDDVEEHVSDSEAMAKKPSKIRKRNLSDSAIEGIRHNNCSTSTPKVNNRMLTKIMQKNAPKATVNKKANLKKEEMNEKKDSSYSEVAVKKEKIPVTSDASDTEFDFVEEKKTTKTNVGMKKKLKVAEPKAPEPKAAEPKAARNKKLFNVSEKVEKKINKTTKKNT